jgi:two-component system response regulator PilR (NtrC family)
MRISKGEENMVNTADKPTLLIVDDETNFAESLQLAIEDVFTVSVAGSLARAREVLKNSMPAAILLDLRLPDGESGELLRDIKELSRLPVVFIMTAYATVESFIKTQHEGAVDYFPKPLDIVQLKRALRIELAKRTL